MGFQGSLLVSIAGVLALVAGLALLAAYRHRKLRVDGLPSSSNADRLAAGTTAGEVLRVRLEQGVEASRAVADQLLRRHVTAKAEIQSSAVLHESSDELSPLEHSLGLLESYLYRYNRPVAETQANEIEEFLMVARQMQAQSASAGPPVYDLLLKLREAIEGANPLPMVSCLAGFAGTITGSEPRDPQAATLCRVLAELTNLSRDKLGPITSSRDERQQALIEIERALDKALNALRPYALAGDATFEIVDLKQSLGAFRRTVENVRIEEADKPQFEVRLADVHERIAVEDEMLSLRFVVSDKSGFSRDGTSVFVLPVTESNDLRYEEREKRKVELKEGRGYVQFTFVTYFFEGENYESKPTIRFDIQYVFQGRRFDTSVNCLLPELVKTQRLVNPFEEGKGGMGLKGESGLFVGRKELLQKITENLLDPKREPLFYLLYGLARTGKTSVLHQLAYNPKWLKGRYIPVEVSAQGSQNAPGFFQLLFDRIREGLASGGLRAKLPDSRFLTPEFAPHWQRVVELLRVNEDHLKERRYHVLLVVDEYQKLAEWDRPEPPERETRRAIETGYFQIPEFLKVLRDQYSHVAVVLLAGQLRLEEMERDNRHWIQQLGGRVHTEVISNFNPREADELIVQRLGHSSIEVPPESLARIREYTAGHPFLQVLMGYHLFDLMLEGESLRSNRKVSEEDVDTSATSVEGADLKFIWADEWIFPLRETRILLAALGELSYEYSLARNSPTDMPAVSIEAVDDYLKSKFGIPQKTYDFTLPIARLLGHDLVKAESDKYRLVYPLFALYCIRGHLLARVIKGDG